MPSPSADKFVLSELFISFFHEIKCSLTRSRAAPKGETFDRKRQRSRLSTILSELFTS